MATAEEQRARAIVQKLDRTLGKAYREGDELALRRLPHEIEKLVADETPQVRELVRVLLTKKAARGQAKAAKIRTETSAMERVATLLETTPGVKTVGDLIAKAEREGDAETMALIRQAF